MVPNSTAIIVAAIFKNFTFNNGSWKKKKSYSFKTDHVYSYYIDIYLWWYKIPNKNKTNKQKRKKKNETKQISKQTKRNILEDEAAVEFDTKNHRMTSPIG